MSDQESTNHEFEPRPLDRSDDLDDLLRKAEWPDPSPAALQRLERRWRQLSPTAKRIRRPWAFAAAAAAVTVVAVGLPVLRQHLARKPTDIVGGPSQAPGPGETDVTQDDEKTDSRSPDAMVLPDGRKPPVERVSPSSPADARTQTPGTGETPSREPRKAPGPRTQRQWVAHFRRLDRQLIDAINRTADDAEITAAEVAEMLPSERDRAYCFQRLPTMIASSDGRQQLAAIDLLEKMDGNASVPILIQLAAVPNCHEEIVRRLAPKIDPATLQNWITAETNPVLQRDMLTTLIGRADEYSVALFLNLVDSRRTRRSALEALREMRNPPSRILLGFFRDPDRDLRMAAVLAVAETNDPGVVDPLIGMVTANYYRLEALMALMRRDDPRSARFVYQVAHHEAFDGAVLSARNGLRHLVN